MTKMRIMFLVAAVMAFGSVNAAEYMLDYRSLRTAPASRTAMSSRTSVGPLSSASSVPVDGNNPGGVLESSVIPGEPISLPALAVGDKLVFALFDDAVYNVELAKKSTSRTFIAKVEGLAGYSAVVSQTPNGVQLLLDDVSASRSYVVGSTVSGTRVTAFDKTAFSRRCEVPDKAVLKRAKAARAKREPVQAVSRTPLADSVLDESAEADTYVDLLVAIDVNAQRYCREQLEMEPEEFAEASIAKMNLALANTGLDEYFAFRVVDVLLVPTSVGKDCREGLYNVTEPERQGRSDLASIMERREEVGADIVSVLIDIGGQSGTVGISWGLDSDDSAPYTSYKNWAINVCNIRNVAVDHTMTHECGHNLGAGHADTPLAKLEGNAGPQLFEYSSGAFFLVDGKYYATIMSYEHYTPGNENVGYGQSYTLAEPTGYFSSPDYTYEDTGVTVGDALHDNTRTIRESYTYVAAFYDAIRRPKLAEALDNDSCVWSTAAYGKFQGVYESEEADSSYDGEDAITTTGTTPRSYLYAQMGLPGEASVWVRPSAAAGALKVSGGDTTLEFDLTSFAAGEWTNLVFAIEGEGMAKVAFQYNASDNGDGTYSTLSMDSFDWSGPAIHTVTFSGGEHGTIADTTLALQYVLDGEAAVEPPVASDYGWNFIGWDADFSAVTGDITVTAQWERTIFEVKFVVDGEVVETILRRYNYPVLTMPDDPEKTGFKFLGWYADFNSGWTYQVDWLTAVTQDIVAKPRWEAEKYDIVFDANGGEGTVTKSLEFGTATGSATVTRDGYIFDGWYTEKEGGTKVQGYMLVSGEATYYAHWHKDGSDSEDDGEDDTGGGSGGEGGEGGTTPPAPPVNPPDEPPAEDDEFLFPADSTEVATTGASTYHGFAIDTEAGDLAAQLVVKVSKPKKSDSTSNIQAVFTGLDGKRATYKTTATIASGAPTTVPFADGRELTIGGASVRGVWDGLQVEGRIAASAKDYAAIKGKQFAVVSEALEAEGQDAYLSEGNYAYVSLTLAAKGKVRVKGYMANGIAFTSTAQAILAEDGSIVIPVVAGKASSKAGSFGMIVTVSDDVVGVDWTTDWTSSRVTALMATVDAGVPVAIDVDLTPYLDALVSADGAELSSCKISTVKATGLLKGTLKAKIAGVKYTFKISGVYCNNGFTALTFSHSKFGRLSVEP